MEKMWKSCSGELKDLTIEPKRLVGSSYGLVEVRVHKCFRSTKMLGPPKRRGRRHGLGASAGGFLIISFLVQQQKNVRDISLSSLLTQVIK